MPEDKGNKGPKEHILEEIKSTEVFEINDSYEAANPRSQKE